MYVYYYYEDLTHTQHVKIQYIQTTWSFTQLSQAI